MSKYNYTGIMLNGSKAKGIVEAKSLSDARTQLKAKKIRIVDLKEKNEQSLFGNRNKRKKLKADSISHFCRQFAIIISSGINSLIGLETLAKRTENKLLSSEINRIVDLVRKGSTIADAMLDKSSKFPRLLGAMVATGEETGTLESVLKSMAVFYEREHRINQKIKNASTYPAIVGILSLVMLFIFTSFIIPQMMKSILEIGAELPLSTKIIMALGGFMGKWWWLVLILIGVGIYVLLQYIKTPLGRAHKDRVINKIPLLGKGISSIVAMRFSRSLYLFVATGYPLLQGLDHIKATLNNSIAEKAVAEAKEGLIRGETLAENLEKHNYFDSVLIQMIAIGEQTGQLETISSQMAEFYEHESDIYLTRLVSMIEPIMIIIVGIMVAILVISVFLPML
ncbi:type II secretion system F family protein, partial [Romboutsia sp.]|uniref:type II secretion system F family protein n=1 Tax=Romboutsia sp. TaxID=1965302 RepID=UPI003F320B0E